MFRAERRYLNKELDEHAMAQDAAFENDTEQYFYHQSRAERFAERADRAHQKHMKKEMKYLKKEALEVRRAEEAMNRGDAAGFAHYQYKAARLHSKAGRTHANSHYPAPEGHSHHCNPYFRGELPTAGCAHEEVPAYAFTGAPPLGRVPFDASTVPALPMAGLATPTATSVATTLTPPPMAMAPPMGAMGGYEEVVQTITPNFQAPIVADEGGMMPTGVPGEFRRVTKPLTFVPLNAQYW